MRAARHHLRGFLVLVVSRTVSIDAMEASASGGLIPPQTTAEVIVKLATCAMQDIKMRTLDSLDAKSDDLFSVEHRRRSLDAFSSSS